MSIRLLTREVAAYEQYGEYFEGAWETKPTHQMLTKLGVPQAELEHVLNSGGFHGVDENGKFNNKWWYLRELSEQETAAKQER